MSFQATTVVTFNDGASGAEYIFVAELDEHLNVESDGSIKSSFSPGESIYVQVNKSSNVDILEIAVTSGTIRPVGTDVRSNTVSNLFVSRPDTEEEEFILSHIPLRSTTAFVGKKGGLEQQTVSLGQYRFIPDTRTTPFIAKISYDYKILSYKWVAPSVELGVDDTYDIALVFYINVG